MCAASSALLQILPTAGNHTLIWFCPCDRVEILPGGCQQVESVSTYLTASCLISASNQSASWVDFDLPWGMCRNPGVDYAGGWVDNDHPCEDVPRIWIADDLVSWFLH